MSIDFMQNLAIIHITFWFTFCRFVFLSLSSSATLLLFHAGLKMYCFYKSFPSVDCQTAFFDGLIGLEFLCSLLYFLKLVQLIFRVSTSLGNSGLCWTVSRRTGTLRCLQKEMATYRHWSVSLWQDPDDVPHCRIPSPDKTEWRLISVTLCGWRRCFVDDQLWFMTRVREEEVNFWLCCDQRSAELMVLLGHIVVSLVCLSLVDFNLIVSSLTSAQVRFWCTLIWMMCVQGLQSYRVDFEYLHKLC